MKPRFPLDILRAPEMPPYLLVRDAEGHLLGLMKGPFTIEDNAQSFVVETRYHVARGRRPISEIQFPAPTVITLLKQVWEIYADAGYYWWCRHESIYWRWYSFVCPPGVGLEQLRKVKTFR